MIANWISSNWENLLKAITAVVGVIFTIHQIRGKLPESRSQLKIDLEILQLLPEKDDRSRKLLKQSIDRRISKIYSGAASRKATDEIEGESLGWFQRIKWGTLIYGLSLLFVFGLWTFSLYNRGSWWAILTGFVAFGGLGNVMLAFNRRHIPKSESAQESPQEDKSTKDAE
jgi:hypothetical protein